MPRAERDIDQCLDFIARQPWGKPDDRELDIHRGIEKVCARPEANRIEHWKSDTGIGLRRCKAAQFVIVYAYLSSSDPSLPGVVSIRAVRHSRVENVFSGVKEPMAADSATPVG
jgi:plasmid stabilization system protein ParE